MTHVQCQQEGLTHGFKLTLTCGGSPPDTFVLRDVAVAELKNVFTPVLAAFFDQKHDLFGPVQTWIAHLGTGAVHADAGSPTIACEREGIALNFKLTFSVANAAAADSPHVLTFRNVPLADLRKVAEVVLSALYDKGHASYGPVQAWLGKLAQPHPQ